jgi:redox-sensitive bicupin YhaK (pirin superfamily)
MTGGYGVAHSEVSTGRTTTLRGVQLWVALPDHARHLPRAFAHHVPAPVRVDGATIRVLLGTLGGQTSPVATHTPLIGAELVLGPRAEISLDVRREFEHGVLVDVGRVLLEGTELARAELGYRPPGTDRLRLANPTAGAARVMLLGGASFTEPILMWWNFVGRSHEEIAGFREEWETGSERFGRVEGYRGPVQRLPAPPMPAVRIKPRLSPPGHGDPSAWG